MFDRSMIKAAREIVESMKQSGEWMRMLDFIVESNPAGDVTADYAEWIRVSPGRKMGEGEDEASRRIDEIFPLLMSLVNINVMKSLPREMSVEKKKRVCSQVFPIIHDRLRGLLRKRPELFSPYPKGVKVINQHIIR